MAKVPFTKNTWIDDIVVAFVPQGSHIGRYSVEVHFSGGTCPSSDFPADIAETILHIKRSQNQKSYPLIVFKGLFKKTGSEDVIALAKVLQAWGFQVHIVVKDDIPYTWLDFFDWKIAIITKPRLLNVDVNEIWYYPVVQADIPDIEIPSRDYKLYMMKGLPVTSAIDFINTSKYTWSLL